MLNPSRWRSGLFICALCLAPAAARAGVIQGTLSVPGGVKPPVAASNPYPGRAGSMPMAHGNAHGAPSDAVLWLERIPAAAESALAVQPAAVPKLAQKDQCFMPRVLAVTAGGLVGFPNLDPIYHNVFSVSPVKRFDLGKYPRGQSKSVRFDRTGVVNVYCDIHSNMEAFVVVVPNHAYAQPDAAGAFRLPDLPAGVYMLHVWHPDLGEIKREVRIPEAGPVALDLSY